MNSHETIYQFEEFRLNPAKKQLLRMPDEEPVTLTNKSMEVLCLLVENEGTLLGKDQIMDVIWPDSHVEEGNLTQVVSVLRKALGETPNQHKFIVTESGRGYRFVASVAVIEESESTSDSQIDPIKSSTGELSSSRVQEPSNWKSNYLIPGSIAIIGVLVLTYVFWPERAASDENKPLIGQIKSIAVLPFRNLDKSNVDKTLGIGMADAVITKLSRTKRIVVRQTSAVIGYAESNPSALKVGREIDVEAVLDGTIQKSGGRVRVSAKLFRASDGVLIWAENFDEQENNIFTLQDSIAERVAVALALELNREDREQLKRRYTDNLEAYELYMRGRVFWNKRNAEDLSKSIAFYLQAIEKDRDYALAYAALAESYVLLHTFSPNQDMEAFPKAKKAAETALRLDQDLAEAHVALALCKEQFDWDWEGAERDFKRAIALNPNYATAHQWYGEFLAFMGRTEESVRSVEKAAALDPVSASTSTASAFPYLTVRRYDTAITKLDLVLQKHNDFPLALYYLGRIYAGKGEYKKSISFYERALKSSKGNYFQSAMIYALAKDGQTSRANQLLADVLATADERPVSRYVLARSYSALGMKEKALSELEAAYEERDSLMIVLTIDQNFDVLRDEDRFKKIMSQLRLKAAF